MKARSATIASPIGMPTPSPILIALVMLEPDGGGGDDVVGAGVDDVAGAGVDDVVGVGVGDVVELVLVIEL